MSQLRFFLIIFFFTLIVNSQNRLKKSIDSLLMSYKTSNQPGLAVCVVKNDDLLYSKGFGIANLDYNVKNTDSTVFSIASLSKQFTASAIWALIQEEKLNLEDNIT
ncbi:MAG: serine hydrolase, partial [Olleya sp.]